MPADRADFLTAIGREPGNYLHRYVYADWLDEHGEHDEADRQRAYEKADRWLAEFAAGHFHGHDAERELTRDDLVAAGAEWVDTFDDEWGEGEWFTQDGSESLRTAMHAAPAREAFWLAWHVVTGRPVPAKVRKTSPFSCSC